MRSMSRFLAGLLAVSLVAGACSEEADEVLFGELLLLVERGEASLVVMETQFLGYFEQFDERVASLSGDDSYSACFPNARSIECHVSYGVFEQGFNDSYNNVKESLVEVRAQLSALHVPLRNPAISAARSAYLDHIRAWLDRYRKINSVMTPDFEDWDAESFFAIFSLNTDFSEIDESFYRLCEELGNGQPQGSQRYKSRIVDICG
jgi:hypothetical protein